MPAIVAIPHVVEELLVQFVNLFPNELLRHHFAEYMTGLWLPNTKWIWLSKGKKKGPQVVKIEVALPRYWHAFKQYQTHANDVIFVILWQFCFLLPYVLNTAKANSSHPPSCSFCRS